MTVVSFLAQTGVFAENKDLAQKIRETVLIPALEQSEQELILDFSGIEDVTQSFIHALISDLIRRFGNEVLERLHFKNCNKTVQTIISIVTDYMQDGDEDAA